MALTYLDYFKQILSWHYFVAAGEVYQAAIAKPLDDLVLAGKTAVIQRFWQFCEDDALPWLLQNYNLDLVESFTADESRQQAGDAWRTWEGDGTASIGGHRWGGGGSEEGILTELARLGYRAALIPVWQYQQTSDGITDTITIQPSLRADINALFHPVGAPPWVFHRDIAIEGEFGDDWWIDLNFHCSSFYVVLTDAPFAFRRWGDPGNWGAGFWDALVTGDRVNLQRIYSTIRKFTGPEFSCRGVVFSYAGRYELSTSRLAGVSVGSTYDAWVVGSGGYSAHWDGYHWTAYFAGLHPLLGVYQNRERVYAVGEVGTILRWDFGSWVAEVSGTTSTLRSFCFAGHDMWAVGAGGIILRNTGTGWSTLASPVATDLNCIFAIGPADIWAVGAGGVSIHWDGATWTIAATGIADDLNGIWGTATNELWAVGAAGTILRWTTAWAAASSPTLADLFSVAGLKDGRAVAAGDALIYFDGVGWKLAAHPLGHRINAVAGTLADNFWIATEEGEAQNLTVTGALFAGNPWGSFTWGDGTRYNLKYVIKYMKEGWE